MDLDLVVVGTRLVLHKAEVTAAWKRKALTASDVVKRWHWYGTEDMPLEVPTVIEVQAALVVLGEEADFEWADTRRFVDPKASPFGDDQPRLRSLAAFGEGLEALRR